MAVEVRAVTAADESQWRELYRGYREFYRLTPDETVVATAWQWVSTGEHGFTGLVAVEGTTVVGIANLRRFARPSVAGIGLFLDDLFTAPAARDAGVATALLQAAAVLAGTEGASVVRWITDPANNAARRVYDRVAGDARWVSYDLIPGAEARPDEA